MLSRPWEYVLVLLPLSGSPQRFPARRCTSIGEQGSRLTQDGVHEISSPYPLRYVGYFENYVSKGATGHTRTVVDKVTEILHHVPR